MLERPTLTHSLVGGCITSHTEEVNLTEPCFHMVEDLVTYI